MKKVSLAIMFAVITVICAQGQEAPPKLRKFSLWAGGSGLFIGSDAFGGAAIGFSYAPSPGHLFTLDGTAGGYGNSQRIGTYGYTITTTQNGQVVKSETFNDGEVSYGYTFTNVMLAWNRVFSLKGKWQLRVGPSVGMLEFADADKYSPTAYKGTDIDGLPDPETVRQTAFMCAATAGLRWNFAERWFADASYRLSYNTGVHFPERNMTVPGNSVTIEERTFGSVGNRLTLVVGWRFGKQKSITGKD
jgi:opacity protein-like surface antigen